MTRFRLTVSTEYDPDPKSYGTAEVAEMLAIDQRNADDDPWGMLLVGDVSMKVVVEDITSDWLDDTMRATLQAVVDNEDPNSARAIHAARYLSGERR